VSELLGNGVRQHVAIDASATPPSGPPTIDDLFFLTADGRELQKWRFATAGALFRPDWHCASGAGEVRGPGMVAG